MKKQKCISCNKTLENKNEIGINQKLLGEKTTVYYCLECLADYFGVTVQVILDKIEEFKEQGCKLFE